MQCSAYNTPRIEPIREVSHRTKWSHSGCWTTKIASMGDDHSKSSSLWSKQPREEFSSCFSCCWSDDKIENMIRETRKPRSIVLLCCVVVVVLCFLLIHVVCWHIGILQHKWMMDIVKIILRGKMSGLMRYCGQEWERKGEVGEVGKKGGMSFWVMCWKGEKKKGWKVDEG